MNCKILAASIGPELTKIIFTLLTGWLSARLLTKNADLISYMSHVQTVATANPPGVVHTFSLFLWNQGKAVAKSVEIGHNFLPN